MMGYGYVHFGMGATEHAKRIDSCLTSERKTVMRKSDIRKETGIMCSLIETVDENQTEKERRKGNVGKEM